MTNPGSLLSIQSILERRAATAADRVALHWATADSLSSFLAAPDPRARLEHESVTFRELQALALGAALGLKELGVGRGDRVLCLIPMSLQLYAAVLGLQRLGAIPVLESSVRRRRTLRLADPSLLPKAVIGSQKTFIMSSLLPQMARIPLRISVGPTSRSYDARIEQWGPGASPEATQADQFDEIDPDQVALITLVGARAGLMEAVSRTHRFLVSQHRALSRCLPQAQGDVDLPLFPILPLNNMASGVTTILPAFDPNRGDATELLLAQLLSTRPGSLALSSQLFRRLAACALGHGIELPHLRRIVIGGAPVAREDLMTMRKVAPLAELIEGGSLWIHEEKASA